MLLFLQPFCSGYKPALEALLLDGILRHDKFIIIEAHLVFGERHIIAVLQVSICCLFIWASLPVLLLGLLKVGLGGIVFVFGTIRIAIISCAGTAMAGFRAAPMTPVF